MLAALVLCTAAGRRTTHYYTTLTPLPQPTQGGVIGEHPTVPGLMRIPRGGFGPAALLMETL